MIFLHDFFDNHPLLLCTLKKSADVLAKLVLWASYCICGISALALAAYGTPALYSIGVEPIRAFLAYAWSGIAFAGSLAAMVPWYVYVGITGVAAIFGYSLMWCIARELTEEDYQSEIAKRVAELLVLLLPVPVLGLALVLWLALLGLVLLWLALVLLPVLVLWLALVLWLGPDEPKVLLFIGAYLHYRKRMKEERK